MERVAAIWYRQLTKGDFWHIERSRSAGPAKGGGQTYVDIPTAVRRRLFEFFGLAEPVDRRWPPIRKDVDTIGAPGTVAPLRFELNREGETRYRIARQLRQALDSERHPAWTDKFGFPRAPDTVASVAEAGTYLPAGGARLFLVRTESGKLYAGHTAGSALPAGWPAGYGLDELFNTATAGGTLVLGADGPALYLDPADPAAPFAADPEWSPEETAVLLDLYVEQGSQPEGNAVAAARERIKAITGEERAVAAIGAKLRALEALDPTSESEAPADAAAQAAWDRFGRDADALRAAVEQIVEGPAIDLDATAAHGQVQKTTIESATITQYRTRGTLGTVAERREQRLVAQYQAHLEGMDHDVSSHTYLLPGYPLPLRCDLFDDSNGTLVEAKGVVSREAVRMAIGQLLDYRRFEDGSPKLAVLLPWRPAPDLIELIHSIGATVVWADVAGGFECAAPPGD